MCTWSVYITVAYRGADHERGGGAGCHHPWDKLAPQSRRSWWLDITISSNLAEKLGLPPGVKREFQI